MRAGNCEPCSKTQPSAVPRASVERAIVGYGSPVSKLSLLLTTLLLDL